MTKGQALILLLAYSLRHHLSKDALQDLLNLLNLLYGNIVPATKYSFFKHFTCYKECVAIHHYCEYCFEYIGKPNQCLGITCCPECHKPFSPDVKGGHFFLTFPIAEQIRQKFEVEDLAGKLVDRGEIEEDGTLRDVMWGQEYKQLTEDAALGVNDISLQLNCDGAAVFKSSG